jgi:hypothetical protein
LDQGLVDPFVDLPQSHHAQTEPKCIEDADIGHAKAMAQPGKVAPSALLGQHRREQIERMHWCQ